MLKPNMPTFNDEEGAKVPAGLPPVIDAHVHIFPDDILAAIQRWFDEHAYAWDRELKALQEADISRATLEKISHKNAVDFFAIPLQSEHDGDI